MLKCKKKRRSKFFHPIVLFFFGRNLIEIFFPFNHINHMLRKFLFIYFLKKKKKREVSNISNKILSYIFPHLPSISGILFSIKICNKINMHWLLTNSFPPFQFFFCSHFTFYFNSFFFLHPTCEVECENFIFFFF